MNIIEAVLALKEGKVIKNVSYDPSGYIKYNKQNNTIIKIFGENIVDKTYKHKKYVNSYVDIFSMDNILHEYEIVTDSRDKLVEEYLEEHKI